MLKHSFEVDKLNEALELFIPPHGIAREAADVNLWMIPSFFMFIHLLKLRYRENVY